MMLSQSLRPLKETSMSVEQLTQELGQLNIVDYLPDDIPSQFLRCTMSRHVKDQLIEESKVRSFFMQLLNIENEEIIKRIAYGKGAKRTLLLECSSSEVAIQIKEKCDKKPSDLLKGKTIYMDFALHHKQKEERDNFLRIENVSSNHLAQDPMQRIPGLIILKEFITKEEEAHLLQQLDQDSKAKWQNDVKARQVQHFGYRFSYVTQRCEEDNPLGEMPTAMQQTIDKIPQDLMDKPDQITANEYLPGQGIAAHIDTHSAFTKAIASLSLENEILMEFRHPDGRCERLMVPTRSLLVMTGASRYEWTHAIPPRAFDVIDGQKVNRKRRVSITFRKLSNTNVCTCGYPVQCDFQQKQNISTTKTSLAPTKMEQQYVHEFYETVAKHFSSTRYAPWPRVAEFVRSLPFGSLVADIGCGNGKYMKCVAPNTSAIVGGDRSESLAKICQEAGLNILVCDALTVPYRSESCDAALSIAVLHHLSTLHHRLQAVKEIIRVLRVGGRGIIYAWALEQTKGSKRRFDQDKQDFYVPWNLDRRFVKKKEKDQEEKIHEETQEAAREATGKKNDKIVVQRFCHMFKQGELEEIVQLAGNAVVEEHYYDESNWAIILRRTS